MPARLTAALLAVAMMTVGAAAGLRASRTPAQSLTPPLLRALSVAADLDGGGAIDTVALRGDDVEITLSERQTAVELRGLAETTALAVDDIDHDGDLDLISLGRDGLRGWVNQGAGTFTSWTVRLSPPTIPVVHVAALHWSPLGPALFPAVAERSSSDAIVPVPLAAGAPFLRTAALPSDADRAPPRRDASHCPPRAPPQTFSA